MTGPTAADFAALREVEVAWLMDNLSGAIANLGYPVGCGVPPSPGHLKRAAETLFERYAKMIEMAHGVGAPAQSMWRSIDTAPRDRTAIWLLLDGQPCIGYCEPADSIFNRTEKWFVKASFRRRDRATNLPDEIYGTYHHAAHPSHWMPLPDGSALTSTQRNPVADSTGSEPGTHGASKEAGGHSRDGLNPVSSPSADLCEGCPPVGYPTDETRCTPCPRRTPTPPEGR